VRAVDAHMQRASRCAVRDDCRPRSVSGTRYNGVERADRVCRGACVAFDKGIRSVHYARQNVHGKGQRDVTSLAHGVRAVYYEWAEPCRGRYWRWGEGWSWLDRAC
jgi:hypothetical protein